MPYNNEIIHRNAMLESRLIDDLLDITRIVNSKISLVLEPIDMHSVIGVTLQDLEPRFEKNGLQLIVHLDATESMALVDRTRMRQVISNLVENAIKFTQDGSIEASTFSSYGKFSVEIIDTGVGLDESSKVRIFEAFEQIHNPGSLNTSGLGLGLAICRNLLLMHEGGAIEVESKGNGHGSLFRVTVATSS